MDLNNYLAYVIISFLTITSPGAAILLAINNGIQYNLKAVVFSTFGNILGLFLLSFVAMFGVGALLKSSDIFFLILKIIGAGYLIYLGVMQILNKHLTFNIQNNKNHLENINHKQIFKKGFLVAATNPKPILFFTAIFPLFISKDYVIFPQFLIMTFTFMIISFCSLLFYGYISKTAKAWFFNEKSLSIFYKISGSLFILMGIGMLFI